jgi:hypothetical protein
MGFGSGDATGANTFQVNTTIGQDPFPTSQCRMNSLHLYGQDGTQLEWRTVDEVAAAGFAYEFTIPGDDVPRAM